MNNPNVLAVISALVAGAAYFAYYITMSGTRKVHVPQNPEDPESPMVEATVPAEFNFFAMSAVALATGALVYFMTSMATAPASKDDFEIEDIPDESW